MAQMTFGAVLSEARERKGYDLGTAARRLRIRPDILRAIEQSDFSRMPPRGYARNMVNAYARLLGLNPTEITRMYLDEAYAYQVGRARSKARNTGFDMGEANRPRRAREKRAAPDTNASSSATRSSFTRTLFDDRASYNRGDYAQSSSSDRLYSENRAHTTRHSVLPNAQYTNFYAGPKAPGVVKSKLPFMVAGALVLVILIVVLFVFSNKGSSDEELPKMNITGLNDTTQQDDSDDTTTADAPPTPKEVAPTSVKVEYSVSDGKQAYVSITNDGKTEGAMLNGPVKKSVEVTGTWSLATWKSADMTITVDGKTVTFDGKAKSGMPVCTVDFATILQQWKKDHPDA